MFKSAVPSGIIDVSDPQFHEHSGAAAARAGERNLSCPENPNVDQKDAGKVLAPNLAERVKFAMNRVIREPASGLGMRSGFLGDSKRDNLRPTAETTEMPRMASYPMDVGVTAFKYSRLKFL